MEKIIAEINESIEGVERVMGEDNPSDNSYLDALYMVRDRIVKPRMKEFDKMFSSLKGIPRDCLNPYFFIFLTTKFK